jgi:GT2 family glycosyltransferase
MSKVDVIILSLVKDDKSFLVTKQCIDSYIETADSYISNIFVVESNKNFNGDYQQPKVKIIKPTEEFNYNRFFNIALEQCQADYIIGPNNDLIILPNCIQTIVEEFETNPKIHSISPVDRNWHRHTKLYLPTDNKLYYGYVVSLHMFGCLFCCRREVFDTIGYLDERFFFFYQDNDYVMSLERNNLKHGVHTGANIQHIGGNSNRIADNSFKYTPENMNSQGNIFHNKWFVEKPFSEGGYRKYKR